MRLFDLEINLRLDKSSPMIGGIFVSESLRLVIFIHVSEPSEKLF